MNLFLRVFGISGALLFGSFFCFTYHAPRFVEEVAKDFIKNRVISETNEKIDQLKLNAKDSPLIKLAEKIYKDHQEQALAFKKLLKAQVHEKIARIIAEMKKLPDETRVKYSEKIKEFLKFQVHSQDKAAEKIQEFIRHKYMEVVSRLKVDLRIFLGSNFLICFLLVIASFSRPYAGAHLLLPGILLLASTSVCSYFYVFKQNWFFTIIYNDYVGYAYLGYVGFLFLILWDIFFNRGRITTEIINALLNAVGSALQVVPG